MSKLKSLTESREAVFTPKDELRAATHGRETTTGQEARWQQWHADAAMDGRGGGAEAR